MVDKCTLGNALGISLGKVDGYLMGGVECNIEDNTKS